LPAFIKVGIAFSAILALSRLGVPLGISMIASTLGLAVWSGGTAEAIVQVLATLILPVNILLLCVILLLLLFSGVLSSSGRMEKTVGAFRSWLKSDRLLLAGLPALIGLLPMPGGALFSAPMVATADSGNRLTPDHKTAINYWFRHIWEYWWPLYPGALLAVQYSGLPIGVFFLIQMPFTAASLVGGYFFLLRRIPQRHDGAGTVSIRPVDVLPTLAPIGALVAISGSASAFLPVIGVPSSLANLYGMLGGLVLVMGWIGMSDRAVPGKIVKILGKPGTWSLMLVVAGALLFSASLRMSINGSGTTLVSLMRDEFLSLGIPFVLIAIIIPFISGMVTGIAVAFVGASFPIVFALLGPQPPMHELIATTSLAYVSGYLGQMLSPVHICFLVTKEYFKTSLRASYRFLWGPAATVALAMTLLCGGYYVFIR
jgi:integral membrane protein (TIGR00529 family)